MLKIKIHDLEKGQPLSDFTPGALVVSAGKLYLVLSEQDIWSFHAGRTYRLVDFAGMGTMFRPARDVTISVTI